MDRSDVIKLITVTETADGDGYVTKAESQRSVFGKFKIGVNRTEFYEAQKAGVQLSATVSMWASEYNEERLLEYNNHKYSIIRAFDKGDDNLELSLAEVIR